MAYSAVYMYTILIKVLCFNLFVSNSHATKITAQQSSDLNDNFASLAIDGNTETTSDNNTRCSSTNNDENPTAWFVTFDKPVILRKVKMYIRDDGFHERLDYFVIKTSNHEELEGHVCYRHKKMKRGENLEVECEARGIRYVGIFLMRKEYLSLCEVQFDFTECAESDNCNVQINAYQSSDLNHNDAFLAIDGKLETTFSDNAECSSTNADNNPTFWIAKFEREIILKKIKIYNRIDSFHERLNGFIIRTAKFHEGHWSECYRHIDHLKKGENPEIICEARGIQFVAIILERKEYLTLCEVEFTFEGCSDCGRDIVAYQSSTFSANYAYFAIDDDFDTTFGHNTRCSSTTADQNPTWWTANFRIPVILTKLKIFNRNDAFHERLNGFIVETAINYEGPSVKCYEHTGQLRKDEHPEVKCLARGIQYVSIILKRKEYLTLCEVLFFYEECSFSDSCHVNMYTYQSSTLGRNNAYLAIDGNTETTLVRNEKCSSTNADQIPTYWAAVFEKPVVLKKVKIYNRLDAFHERLNGFVIGTSKAGNESFKECYKHRGNLTRGEHPEVKCEAVGIQLVTISVSRKEYLTLCEVQFTLEECSDLTSCANNITAHQSSEMEGKQASLAIDGNRDTCSSTDSVDNPTYWTAVFERPVILSKVSIYTHGETALEQLSDFIITTSNHNEGPWNECYRHTGQLKTDENLEVACEARDVKFVIIYVEREEHLTLCEVKFDFQECFDCNSTVVEGDSYTHSM